MPPHIAQATIISLLVSYLAIAFFEPSLRPSLGNVYCASIAALATLTALPPKSTKPPHKKLGGERKK